MESIVKVTEKAIVYEEWSNTAISFGAMMALSAVILFLGAAAITFDLHTITNGAFTEEMTRQLIQQAVTFNIFLAGCILLAFAALGIGFYLRWMVNHDKELGGVYGVADVEIAILERRIRKQLEKNKKARTDAQLQIRTIDEIEKRAEEKKLIEPGQTTP